MSILRKLLGQSDTPRERPAFSAPIQPDSTLCVIGDVHGCITQLDELLAQVTARDDVDEIVFVGDYVDRGPDSRAVIDRLMALEQERRVICLRGNHEEMMLTFIDNPGGEGRRWLRFGGVETMESFGVEDAVETSVPAATEALGATFSEAVGQERIDWLWARPGWHRNGNVVVVHAAADPTRAMEVQSPGHLTWGHPEFGRRPRGDGLWVVHGHTIVQSILPKEGVIGVDTGAYSTGTLSGVILKPDGDVEVVQATQSPS